MAKNRDAWVFVLLFAAYLGLCAGLLLAPDRGVSFFFLLEILIVLIGWWMGPGVTALLVLAVSLLCLGLWGQWPSTARIFAALAVPQLWTIWALLRFLDQKSLRRRYEQEASGQKWSKQADEFRKDIDFYRGHGEKMKAESAQRQHLAACARDLGAVLNPSEIQSRLLRWVQTFFPRSHGILSGLTDSDPVDAWVSQRRQPLLCDDLAAVPRFRGARVEAGTRSLMVAPLWVESKLFGGLRVEDPAPRRFGRDDLRVLDALATLGSLALDNSVLYHRIEELAVRDGLTKLLTHRAFQERLEEEFLRAGRYRFPMSLIMLDVDHFKRVNDTYGHAAGDEVLRRVSGLLARAARPVDAAARYGGEEFTLLLVETDHAAAVRAAESLRQAVAAERYASGGRAFAVTASLGVATYPEEATTPPQLIRLADQRLYKAKTGGRDRVAGRDQ